MQTSCDVLKVPHLNAMISIPGGNLGQTCSTFVPIRAESIVSISFWTLAKISLTGERESNEREYLENGLSAVGPLLITLALQVQAHLLRMLLTLSPAGESISHAAFLELLKIGQSYACSAPVTCLLSPGDSRRRPRASGGGDGGRPRHPPGNGRRVGTRTAARRRTRGSSRQ